MTEQNAGQFKLFSQIVESNGKTIRENNMALQHKIPLKTLVEVKFDHWHGKGACQKVHARMFVCEHTRDCDGTPLYSLSTVKMTQEEMIVELKEVFPNFQIVPSWIAKSFFGTEGGFSEESLTPVEVTPELVYGEKSLSWDEEKGQDKHSPPFYEDDHYCLGKYLKALRQALAGYFLVFSKSEDPKVLEWAKKNSGNVPALEILKQVLFIEGKMLEEKSRDLDDPAFKSE